MESECTVVMYHYVRNMHETDYPDIKGLLIDKFVSQLDHIARNYSVMSMSDYYDYLAGKRSIPLKSCVLTFDDGLKDHYTTVFPELKKRGWKAIFYPITLPLAERRVPPVIMTHFIMAKLGSKSFADSFNDLLRRRFPDQGRFIVTDGPKKQPKYRWDDNLTANLKYSIACMPHAMKSEILQEIFSQHFDERVFCDSTFLSEHEIREMASEGMEFGAHTHTHPMLAELSAEEQGQELSKSKKILESVLSAPVRFLSYPYGSLDGNTLSVVKDLGFVSAVVTEAHVNKGLVDPFRIARLDTNDLL